MKEKIVMIVTVVVGVILATLAMQWYANRKAASATPAV